MKKHRAVVALACWTATGVLLSSSLRQPRQVPIAPPLPALGSTVEADAIKDVFSVSLSRIRPSWILALTSSCEYCLSLGPELPAIAESAACEGADLRVLIVEVGAQADSMLGILASHGLTADGVAGRAGLKALEVWAVPTVLMINGEHEVIHVANPALPDSWPPRSCGD